ncbi:MAG: 30S ribosomal protein S17 [Patescibacteria group bacterium]
MAKKQKLGTIISNKMQKTVVVRVERIKESKKYKKRYKVQKKYKAHVNEQNYNIGDIVLIEECRPISKDKKWKVIKKIVKSQLSDSETVLRQTQDSLEDSELVKP